MAEKIIGMLDGFPPELIIFAISLLPILELRGGLVAAAILNVEWYIAFPICVIGNLLPIPIVLLFFREILRLLKKIPFLKKFTDWLDKKIEKNRSKFEAGTFIALLTFVGIPLPGTGAWTGAMLANMFDMRLKKSIPAIILGVLLAGVIMSVLSYFVPGLFGF